jgi:D-threo-aldose 1-dehydrogenase
MPFDPFELVSVGRAGLRTTRLGLGGASIAGLYDAVAEADAVTLVRHAWSIGIRSFDVAPLYGYGAAERRVGLALAGCDRAAFVISTKVGRLVREPDAVRDGDELDEQRPGQGGDGLYPGAGDRRVVFDYSFDGVMCSVEESLDRLGLDHVDIAYVHDAEHHLAEAIEGAYPALQRLREQGVVRSIGAGMVRCAPLARLVRETDMDVVMIAGRYTLLDQEAAQELLPLCHERGVSVMVAGVMNSGVLADPDAAPRLDYAPAPRDVVERAARLAAACDRHGVTLRTAAIQFPLAHPAVTGLIAGVRTAAHLDEYPAAMRGAVPPELWDELRSEGLISALVPTPG